MRVQLKHSWWWLRRLFWRGAAALLPKSWAAGILRLGSGSFLAQIKGAATDKLVELLLVVMDLAFAVGRDYREANLRGFRARYLIRTAGGQVQASAVFTPGNMSVRTTAIADPDVTITFTSPAAIVRFLSSKEKDILDSLLAQEVEVDGNLNLVYKFGFMARQLLLRVQRIFG